MTTKQKFKKVKNTLRAFEYTIEQLADMNGYDIDNDKLYVHLVSNNLDFENKAISMEEALATGKRTTEIILKTILAN